MKGARVLPKEAHPSTVNYRELFRLDDSGRLESDSVIGIEMITRLRLNESHHVAFRRHVRQIEAYFSRKPQRHEGSRLSPYLFEWLRAWKNPVWGTWEKFSELDFQITTPTEIGKVLNEGLMDYLKNKPERINELDGTMFEEVVAELLAHRGFHAVVHLGRRKDTGADILAVEQSPITGVNVRYFVEAKLWSRKVGVEVVDRVCGAITNERPKWGWHMGLIVAPAGWKKMVKFTDEELKFLGIELKDRTDLETWLNEYSPAPSGIWLPTKQHPEILPSKASKLI